jgi:hypothetical protein
MVDWTANANKLQSDLSNSVECSYYLYIFDSSGYAKTQRDNFPDRRLDSLVNFSTALSYPCGLHELAVGMPISDFNSYGFSYNGMKDMSLEFKRNGYSSVIHRSEQGATVLRVMPPHEGKISQNGKISLELNTEKQTLSTDCNVVLHSDSRELYCDAATIMLKNVLRTSQWMGYERSGENADVVLYSRSVERFDVIGHEEEPREAALPLEDSASVRPHSAKYNNISIDNNKLNGLFSDYELRTWLKTQNTLYPEPIAAVFQPTNDRAAVKERLLKWQMQSKDSNSLLKDVDYYQQDAKLAALTQTDVPILDDDAYRTALELVMAIAPNKQFVSHSFWHTTDALNSDLYRQSMLVTVEQKSSMTSKRREPDTIRSFQNVLWNISAQLDAVKFSFEWLSINGLEKLAYMLLNKLDVKFNQETTPFKTLNFNEFSDDYMRIVKLLRAVRDAERDNSARRQGTLASRLQRAMDKYKKFAKDIERINGAAKREVDKIMEEAKKHIDSETKKENELKKMLFHAKTEDFYNKFDTELTRDADLHARYENVSTDEVEKYRYLQWNVRVSVDGYVLRLRKGDGDDDDRYVVRAPNEGAGDDQPILRRPEKQPKNYEFMAAGKTFDVTQAAFQALARLLFSVNE